MTDEELAQALEYVLEIRAMLAETSQTMTEIKQLPPLPEPPPLLRQEAILGDERAARQQAAIDRLERRLDRLERRLDRIERHIGI
jgi:hypothetical protein